MHPHDVSIIIQGPLHEHSILNIDNYLKFADQVIVSCYPEDLTGKTCNMSHRLFKDNSRIQTVVSSVPNCRFFNTCHVFNQSMTALKGLEKATTKWSIKVRTDERYSDLSKFIEVMKSSSDKLTTNNVFFKRSEPEPYHPSDHLVGGLTDSLKDVYSRIQRWCFDYPYQTNNFMFGSFIGLPFLNGVSPETMLCKAYLDHKGIQVPLVKDVPVIRQIMKENFNCVSVNDLGSYIWSVSRNGQRQFHTVFTPENSDNSINSIEEL